MIEQITILAPGLLGGSVAKAAYSRRAAKRIVVWSRRPDTRRALSKQNFVNAVADTPEAAVQGASLVIIASPVSKITPLVAQISAYLPKGCIVTDVGSVKDALVKECTRLLLPHAYFVGSHPMAGSEKTGWENSTESLFDTRTCFITPLPKTNKAAVKKVAQFWKSLGAHVVYISPKKHDKTVANISHLPQVVASTLCSSLLGSNSHMLKYAGNGLKDTTRIAGSDPELWKEILELNRIEVLKSLTRFKKELTRLERALKKKSYSQVIRFLHNGKTCRERFILS
jgi:cyclohexadieny/prephenate dehydrogenase